MRRAHYRNTYGMEKGEYEARLEAQSHACKLCRKPAAEMVWAGKPSLLAVDHDHRTGAVRGLLCHACNSRVAMIDDPQWSEWLEMAREYLGR
jgi:hypothetical protein